MEQKRVRVFEQSEAGQYIDKLAGALKRDPASVSDAKKQTIERVASILTGLYVLSNKNFRKTLKVSDEKFNQVIAGLSSTPGAAGYTIKAGSRLPSILKVHTDSLKKFSSMKPAEQQAYVDKLKTLYDTVKKGVEEATNGSAKK
jgi:hypothetical protein